MNLLSIKPTKVEILTEDNLAALLDCSIAHASDILAGTVKPTPRETAIVGLVNSARVEQVKAILSSLSVEKEWKTIPGYSKYEASVSGSVRRAKAGHGSQAGKVLKPKIGKWGHLYVNLSNDLGQIKTVGVHVAVCLAFHGEPPVHKRIACHKSDIVTDNTPDNLYWGTHSDNAKDRERNKRREASGERRARWPNIYGPPSLSQLRRHTKERRANAS